MLLISGISALLLAVLGIAFFCGKRSSLIAGYNTASPEEKNQIDENALCRAMGSLMFVLAACCGIMALSGIFDHLAFLWIGLALLVVAAIGGVIYINNSKKINKRK